MYIYKISNLVNGKSYVGRTSCFERRMKEHKKKGSYMRYFFDQYGIENFSFEIICKTKTKEETYQKEIEMIKIHNTLEPNGYNRSKGGISTLGFHHSEETKKAISLKRKGKYTKAKNPFYGKKHTLETRNKMRKSWENREVTETMMNNIKKGTEKVKRKVIAVETQEEFDCIQRASEKYNVAATNISRACREPNRTAAKLHWKYK